VRSMLEQNSAVAMSSSSPSDDDRVVMPQRMSSIAEADVERLLAVIKVSFLLRSLAARN
jgi:hypothetical protein